MRIATWNIHKCVGSDGIFNPERIISVIGKIKPDVMALQEADERFGRRKGLLSTDKLAAHGLRIVPVKGNKADSHGWCGNVVAVSASMKVINCELLKLPGIEPRGAIIVDAFHTPSDTAVRVIACHMGLLRRCRIQQVKSIVPYIKNARGVVFVIGDTNEWRSEASSENSLFRIFGTGLHGNRPVTFPSRYPLLGLDRILSDRKGTVYSVQSREAAEASDHLPVYMDVNISR